MDEFDTLQGFLEHVSLVMDADTADGEDARLADDAARRQGPGVRRGVPARLGGGPVPAPAQPGRERHTTAWRRSGGSPTSASPGPGARPRSASCRTAAPAACGSRPRPRALSTSCRSSTSTSSRCAAPMPAAGSGYGNPYGRSRFEEPGAGFNSGYSTPGWQRAKEQWGRDDRRRSAAPTVPRPSRASWWPPRRPRRRLPRGSACSTRSSATGTSPRSTATSSPSTSTRPARSGCWTASWCARCTGPVTAPIPRSRIILVQVSRREV